MKIRRLILASSSSVGALFLFVAGFAQGQNTLTPSNINVPALRSTQPDYVVELFTSQGCSSCPKANKFVAKLAQSRDDALVLSYGVTYWDYLGWKDTFGDPAFTQRQRDYGKSLGAPNIYTPQLVLNGAAHSPRYSMSDIISMPLDKARPKPVLAMTRSGQLSVRANVPSNYTLSVITYMPGLQEVSVKRGENRGRTMEVENVVERVQKPEWNGQSVIVNVPTESGRNYAVLFQTPNTANVVTAAVLKR